MTNPDFSPEALQRQQELNELQRLKAENARLEREAEWLADKLKQYKCPSITYKGEIMSLREAARKAVEES